MSKNTQRLGSVLSRRMKATAGAAVPTTMELGRIGGNLSLTTDSLRAAIPRGEYMVNIMLTGSKTINGESLPNSLRSLSAGDRVLVAWCGNEPVVIAIVTGS